MTEDLAEGLAEWVEVNIVPTSSDQDQMVLLDVIEPLIHRDLAGSIDIWFYGLYSAPEPYHVRLRIRWQNPAEADTYRRELFACLDEAQRHDKLTSWYEGSHGAPNETYTGEADEYGALWEVTCRDWMSGSELALAFIRSQSEGTLTNPREYHLERRAHLQSNRLGFNYLDEARLYVQMAHGYLTQIANDPQNAKNAQLANVIQVLHQIYAALT
jgi:hypothetical protein